MRTPLLTVFTPAYNRAHTLPRTYESLCGQKNKEFIWLVVDDGSGDNTAELVKQWQGHDNGFEIRYVYKENGGMHTAHNTAYAMIDTELNVCIDSDDALAADAVQVIADTWEKVRDQGYAGLLGLDADFDNRIIGTGFPEGLMDTTLGNYYKNGGRGDKKLVLRTDVVRKYPPYPTFEGERFVPLGSLYTMIDRDYRLYVVNEVLCLVEYMADGSTRNIYRQYKRNPKGFRYSRLISLSAPEKFKRKLVLHAHYVAESVLGKQPIFRESPSKLLSFIALPVGAALACFIKVRGK